MDRDTQIKLRGGVRHAPCHGRTERPLANRSSSTQVFSEKRNVSSSKQSKSAQRLKILSLAAGTRKTGKRGRPSKAATSFVLENRMLT